MLGLAILLLFNLLGLLAHDYLFIPLPANVLGMLFLLAALCLRIVKLHHVEGAASLFLRHMMLLFAPLIVGTLALGELVASHWLTLVATLVLSTLITLVATAAIASIFPHAAPPAAPPPAPSAMNPPPGNENP